MSPKTSKYRERSRWRTLLFAFSGAIVVLVGLQFLLVPLPLQSKKNFVRLDKRHRSDEHFASSHKISTPKITSGSLESRNDEQCSDRSGASFDANDVTNKCFPGTDPYEKNVRKLTNGDGKKNDDKRMNILFLYADDWRHDTLGVAGNPVIRTPHIDNLATKGVRFTRACVTTSICGISRATLQTGQYFSRHRSNPHDPKQVVPEYYDDAAWSQTLVGLLRDNGYFVGHVGKWHANKKVPFPKHRFDYATNYYDKHVLENGNHVTAQNEIDAMEFLRLTRNTDKPFFLNVAFFATHAEDTNPKQYIPQNTTKGMYANDLVPMSPNANMTGGDASAAQSSFNRLPNFINKQSHNESRKRWKRRYETPELFQRMMKNMYRMASEVDTVCGRLIAELKRMGVYDDTLIVFTADNGNIHGEHGLADKWYPYEESVRVPLIIVDPRMADRVRNTINDEIVLNVDLAPTLLTAAGVDPPYGVMQGRDAAELYLGAPGRTLPWRTLPWRTEFFYEHPHLYNERFIPSSQALIRKDMKLFYWPGHRKTQMFDLTTDPYEEKDIYADSRALAKPLIKRMNVLKEQVKG